MESADFLSILGRELAEMGRGLGVAEAVGQDGYEAFVKAGLTSALTTEGLAALDGADVARLCLAFNGLWEVDVPADRVRAALAQVIWHCGGA